MSRCERRKGFFGFFRRIFCILTVAIIAIIVLIYSITRAYVFLLFCIFTNPETAWETTEMLIGFKRENEEKPQE